MKTSKKAVTTLKAAALVVGLFAGACAHATTYTYRVPAQGVTGAYTWEGGGGGAAVPGAVNVSFAGAGRYGASALKVDGTMWTSGAIMGALPSSNGAPTNRTTFAPIADTSKFIYVANRTSSLLAVKDDGTLWASGYNDQGQLGDGTMTNRLGVLVQVGNGATNFVMADASSQTSVALKQDGTIWGAGRNFSAEIGGPSATQYTSFVNLANGEKFVWVGAIRDGAHALKADGTLWNVGRNDGGGMGDGSCGTGSMCYKWPWGPSGGAHRFVQVAPSSWWTVARKADGTLWCAGGSYGGKFGVPDASVWKDFAACGPGHVFTDVAVGSGHTIALKADGTIWATGDNGMGQFGNGTTTSTTAFVQVDGGRGPFVKVMSSWDSSTSMALHADGSLWVTGNNSWMGHIGAGAASQVTTWTKVLPE